MAKKTIAALTVCLVALTATIALSACVDRTPNAVTEAFPDLAEDAAFSGADGNAGDCAVLDFGTAVTFNTLVLRDKKCNVTCFRLYADDSDLPFYGNDYIDGYRYCSFDTVTASRIKIEIASADGEWELEPPEAYYITDTASEFRIMGYVNADYAYSLTEEQAATASKVTDFNIFGAAYFDKDGNVRYSDYEIDGIGLNGKEVIKGAVVKLKKANPSADVVATVLGNKDFSDGMAVNERHNSAMGDNADKLIDSLLTFVNECGLDGVSFDYEYPEKSKDYDIYAKFAKKLKAALPADKLLTAAISLWNIGIGKLSEKDLDAFDHIELMSYDMFDDRGNHAAFYSSAYDVVKQLNKKGLDACRFNLGIPFYSRPVNGDAYWGKYSDVADKLSPFENSYVEAYTDLNSVAKPPLRNYYNGRQMVYDKTAFAVDSGLGGVMIWHIGTDSTDPELSLINVIGKAVSSRT